MAEPAHALERLDFTLDDFTRLSWASDRAREAWHPRMARIGAAWSEIEWRSVKDGVRRCALSVVSPEALIEQGGVWAKHGLGTLPLEMLGVNGYTYSSTSVAPTAGQPFGFRVVVGTPADVGEFKAAFDDADDVAMGKLLGFPACCQQFFREVWVDDGMVDTTWPMAVRTGHGMNGDATLDVSGPAEANILWRWMGLRMVPHLPCRFDCEETADLGRRLMRVGRDAGYDQEMSWLAEILSWPVEWSALHGIAEVKTPLLRVSTRTDATARKYTVRRKGDGYPGDGASGLDFPYRRPRKPIVTGSAQFKRGLSNPIERKMPFRPWYAADNGFGSVLEMDAAHEPIAALALATLGPEGGAVLDLGCGNGALLKKLHGANPHVTPFGIDHDAERLRHAGELMPAFADNFVRGDLLEDDRIWSGDRRFALALLMPGRLLESGPDAAARLMERLSSRCDHLLVYAYGDWLNRHGDLRQLARKAGLRLVSGTEDARAGLAIVSTEGNQNHA